MKREEVARENVGDYFRRIGPRVSSGGVELRGPCSDLALLGKGRAPR